MTPTYLLDNVSRQRRLLYGNTKPNKICKNMTPTYLLQNME